MFATIGAVLASNEFKLTASGEEKRRKSAGKPRARNSDLRRPHAQTCPEVLRPSFRVGPTCTCHKRQRQKLPREQRAARRLYRSTHPRYWALRTIVSLLLVFAEDVGHNSVRRWWLTESGAVNAPSNVILAYRQGAVALRTLTDLAAVATT